MPIDTEPMAIETIVAMLTLDQQQCLVDLSPEWKSSGYNKVYADLVYATDNITFPKRFPPLVDCRYHQHPGRCSQYHHRLLPLGEQVKQHLMAHKGLTTTPPLKPRADAPPKSRKGQTLIRDLETFQARVGAAITTVFGKTALLDRTIRQQRFFEEAAELSQSGGLSRQELHAIVDYVCDRAPGDLSQEAGGVLITLAALCVTEEINLFGVGEAEIDRILKKIDVVRAKEAAKPVFKSTE